MKTKSARAGFFLSLVSLFRSRSRCADDLPIAQTPPPSQATVFQNIGYVTNIYSAPTSPSATLTTTTTQTPETITVDSPPPPVVVAPPPPPPTATQGVTILPPPVAMSHERDLRSTGRSASCDAYLARVEVCSRRMMSRLPDGGGDALDRIVRSLDMSRRAWRNNMPDLSARQRASLSETCTDSQSLYDSSASSSCN